MGSRHLGFLDFPFDLDFEELRSEEKQQEDFPALSCCIDWVINPNERFRRGPPPSAEFMRRFSAAGAAALPMLIVAFRVLLLPALLLVAFSGFGLGESYSLSQTHPEKYRAAVVSTNGFLDLSEYLSLLHQALSGGEARGERTPFRRPNIIVFPEISLNQSNLQAERVLVGSNPCLVGAGVIMRAMSCGIRDRTNEVKEDTALFSSPSDSSFPLEHDWPSSNSTVFLVFNLRERGEKCFNRSKPDCRLGHYIYNTAVVMDGTGSIITKYRKSNLYIEDFQLGFRAGDGEPMAFRTPFGTFGVFVCWDVVFQRPAQELVTKFGIRDFVWPNHEAAQWTMTQPSDTWTLGVAWSEIMGARLLSSDCITASSGTGVVVNGRPIVVTMDKSRSRVLFADVDVDEKREPQRRREEVSVVEKKPGRSRGVSLQSFEAVPGTSDIIVVESNTMRCTVVYTVANDDNRTQEDQDDFFAVVAETVLMDLDLHQCGLYNCGKMPSACAGKSRYRNMATSTSFDFVSLTKEYIGSMQGYNADLPQLTTSGRSTLSDGQFEFVHEGSVLEVVSTKELQEPVLEVFLVGLWNNPGKKG